VADWFTLGSAPPVRSATGISSDAQLSTARMLIAQVPRIAPGAGSRLRSVESRSLTIILPAYNEERRLGPALDELFGYLRRRGPGRDGLPAPDELSGDVRVLVVDDGSTDGTAALVRARPEARMAHAPVRLSLLTVAHGG